MIEFYLLSTIIVISLWIKKTENVLFYSFIGIFLFSAIRYNFGSDYKQYERMFLDLNSRSWKSYDYEIGWVYLNRYLLNFRVLLIVTSLFNNFVVYNLVKKFVDKKYYWIALFIYLFNPDIFLVNLSMMRQTVATSFILLAFLFCTHKKYIKSILLLMLAFCFHRTSIICVILYPLWFLIDYKKNVILLFLTFLVVSLTALNFFENQMQIIMSIMETDDYGKYMIEGTSSWGIGVILKFIITFFLLYAYVESKNSDKSFFLIIAAFSFIFIPLSNISVMLMRLSMYFVTYYVFAIPIALENCRKLYLKKVLIFIVLVLFLYSSFAFFNDPIYGGSFKKYSTFLS